PTTAESLRHALTYSWINVLLLCNPVAWALHYSNQAAMPTFVVALLGVIPLAGLLGFGTESIALYTGDALGGLINATLGNATEFIIAILLLVKCEIRVVQASLLGGLLSNLLLVLGMAFLVGGIRYSEQEFMQTAAQLNTNLMTLAVTALIFPSAFAFALGSVLDETSEKRVILEMSRGSSIILIIIYITYMVFQLYSHAHYYNPAADTTARYHSSSSSSSSSESSDDERSVYQRVKRRGRKMTGRGSADGNEADRVASEGSEEEEHERPEANIPVALAILLGSTGLTYLTAEALTDSLEKIGESGSVTPEWLGLILLAVVGNAAEHVTAVFVAYRNKVDLALSVSVGSCIQIALFVIPLLVLIGWIIDKPLSLLFDPLETVTLFLSVLLVRFATEDGRTHYMSGVALVGTYILIAFSFWFYPSKGTTTSGLFDEEVCRTHDY
ncbi:Sodium/calcium exchanger protein-domain-containing protein, partial [Auriculariales sp. MPI-PUGE-AT-0066]